MDTDIYLEPEKYIFVSLILNRLSHREVNPALVVTPLFHLLKWLSVGKALYCSG